MAKSSTAARPPRPSGGTNLQGLPVRGEGNPSQTQEGLRHPRDGRPYLRDGLTLATRRILCQDVI